MAQEREKTRIVLASILKPVDDTRMTEKMGTTLAAAGYEVSVIGYPSQAVAKAGVACYTLSRFRRISLGRWLARWKVYGLAFKCRPNVFIFSTHELILPAILLKVILGTRIIYDVRENYYRNILHSEGLSPFVRWLPALLVRGLEKVTAPMIDHYFLAERGYEHEFRFHRGGWTTIENKSLRISQAGIDRAGWNLLFSGTLSESTGVFRAIRLVEALNKFEPAITLTIAGYAAAGSVREKIRKEVEGKNFIQLIGIDELVPHTTILEEIQRARAGIIAYPQLPQTINSTPTKLYEYLTLSLPILCESSWPWISRFESCQPFVMVDFENPDADVIIRALKQPGFYPMPAADANWDSESPKLLEAIKNIA